MFDRSNIATWAPLAIFVGYFLFALYVWAPMKTKKRSRVAQKPERHLIAEAELPPDVAASFRSMEAQVQPRGFARCGFMRMDVPASHQRSYLGLWAHPVTLATATSIAIHSPTPTGGVRQTYSNWFSNLYADDKRISTGSTANSGVFPRNPDDDSLNFAGLRDFAILHEIHQARVAAAGRKEKAVAADADVCEFQQGEWVRTYERLIRLGYYRTEDDMYVPTLKGAFMMTYRLLPPFKQIRRRQRTHLLNRTLKQLNLGTLSEILSRQRFTPAPIFDRATNYAPPPPLPIPALTTPQSDSDTPAPIGLSHPPADPRQSLSARSDTPASPA